jgi:plasmid stabilization system protein ParE
VSRYRVDITKSARARILDISRWWQTNWTKSPLLFRDELVAARSQIARVPSSGPAYASPEHRDVRRLLMLRTQYHLYYVIDEEQRVVTILAVWHTARGNGPPL